MKIGNLAILAITLVLGTLSASAQEPDGSITFTDHSNRSITISRFGTVLSFKNSNGKKTAPANIYRVCPCGEKGPCIESATIPSKESSSKLEVEFPKEGTTLKEGQTLIVVATFRQGELTVRRRLSWEAGSGSVKTEEFISASKPLCSCTFEDKAVKRLEILAMKMCPPPPGPGYLLMICPPYTELHPDAVKQMMVVAHLDFSK